MELAELVERIQRWKQRNDAEQTGQESHSAYNENQGSVERAQPTETGEIDASEEVENYQVVEEEMEVDAEQIVSDGDETDNSDQ